MHRQQALMRVAHRQNIAATAKKFGVLLKKISPLRPAIERPARNERYFVTDKVIITGEAPKRHQAGLVVTLKGWNISSLAWRMAQVVMHGVKPMGECGARQVNEQISFFHQINFFRQVQYIGNNRRPGARVTGNKNQFFVKSVLTYVALVVTRHFDL